MADSRNLVLQLLITARDEAGGVLDGLRTRLGNLSGIISGALKAGFVALGVAVTAAFKGGLDDAAAFETVMARIQVAGVKNTEQLAQLAEAAKRLGAETGAGAVPAAEALEGLVKAGLNANQALAVLPNVIDLASGQMLNLSDAADLVVNTVNQFGLKFEDSKTIVDVFSAGANAATTSVQDLRQGLENAGLAARTSGLTLQDTIAVINTLKQSGQGASEAGNALENMLNELGNAASPAREALRSVGVATGDFNTVVNLLAQGGPAATTVLNAFSDTARTAGGILANSLPFYQDQVKQLKDINVTAADGAKIMGGTYADSVKSLSATWNELWQTLAQPVLPKLAAMFQEATTFIRENKQAISDWIATGLSPLTQAIDGYRLAWALVKGEQEKAAQIQQDIEDRTAAIGRVLSLTSGEYQKNTAQIQQNAAAGKEAASVGQQTAAATQAQAEQLRRINQALTEQDAAIKTTQAAWEDAKAAYQAALDTGQNLEAATQILAQRSKEYGDALEQQTRAQLAAKEATKAHAANVSTLRDAYDRQVAEVARLKTAQESGQATSQQVTDAQLKLRRAADDYTGAAQLETQAVIRLGEKLEAESATTEKNAAAKLAQQQALLQLAQARGDEAAAAQAQADIAAIELAQARDLAALRQQQATQAAALLGKKQQEYALTIQTNVAQQQEIRLLQETVAQKQAEAREAEAGIAIKERERRQAEIMAGPIGALTRLYADQATEHQRASDASARYQDAQTQEAENALKLAQIKGDEQEIDKAQTALNEQKIAQAQALADARAVEATDAENALSAKALELAADGELSQADQKQLKDMEAAAAGKREVANAAQQTVDQLGKEADATKKASEEHQKATSSADGLSAKLGQITQSARANMGALSEQAKVYFDMMTGISAGQYGIISGFDRASEASSAFNAAMSDGEKEMVTFRSEITAANAAIKSADNSLSHSTGSLGVYLDSLAKASAQTTKAFYEQKLAAKELELSITGMAEKGTLTMSSLQIATRRAGNEFSLLDEEDLSGLTSALDEANQKLREMQEETQSAAARLAELNAEIAAERGDTATADRLKLELDQQQQIAEVEAQLAQARAQNNRELIA
ncbi:MAG: phage tail tape measure protein, partial [Candidatus Contendobacter sp.]|nr:phage tail tape measure protein [Candidatus Contendobacter sp.]